MRHRTIEWCEGKVRFLDQTRLPQAEIIVETDDYEVLAKAIQTLAIRGAPLIGIAAAYGIALAARRASATTADILARQLEKPFVVLGSTRPTAVNLTWALDRLRRIVEQFSTETPERLRTLLQQEALAIHGEDAAMCTAIGNHGADCLPHAAVVLTHCNTGALATGGRGTAQGVISTAWEQHKLKHVYINETRPLLQGARLTAWELESQGIPCTLMVDSVAGFLMQRGIVNAVVVGADRITRRGDVANKVGTYSLAVLARYHDLPFYVAAPSSTLDFELDRGKEIPIEERSGREVTEVGGQKVAPEGVSVYSPAFDITPAELVSGLITEKGIHRPPFHESLNQLRSSLRRGSVK